MLSIRKTQKVRIKIIRQKTEIENLNSEIEMAMGRSRIDIHRQHVNNQYYKVVEANWQKNGRKTEKTIGGRHNRISRE